MRQIGIFNGRVQICYAYGRFGWTRNGGKTWHGGIDLVGLDDKTIRMPFYKGKKISGKVPHELVFCSEIFCLIKHIFCEIILLNEQK